MSVSALSLHVFDVLILFLSRRWVVRVAIFLAGMRSSCLIGFSLLTTSDSSAMDVPDICLSHQCFCSGVGGTASVTCGRAGNFVGECVVPLDPCSFDLQEVVVPSEHAQ